MTERKSYNLETLTEAIKRDSAVLLKEYDKTSKRTTIIFKCHCGEEGSKNCLEIVSRAGAFCKKCTLKRSIEKTKTTIQTKSNKTPICTIKSLENTIKRYNAILLDNYNSMTKNTIVHFRCNCGEKSHKNSLQLISVSGAFCEKCTRKQWTEKQKANNLQKYGVECTVHAPGIKEKIEENNLRKYGSKNVFGSTEIKNKIKITMLRKYGVQYVLQIPIYKEKLLLHNSIVLKENKEKIKRTCLIRYGVNYVSQSLMYKIKYTNTCIRKYGVPHISQTKQFKEKVKQTFLKNYGVDNPNKTKVVRDKIKKTCIEKYGVEYPSQNKEVQEKTQKNAKKYKEYKMPCGEIRKVQGYEPFALDYLVTQYKEDDIKTNRKDVPRIPYVVEEKRHYYFPDIYIPSENKIIEVKSTWTYKCKTDNIPHKEKATKEAGYNYEIWVYNKKGEKIQIEDVT
jgi:hypothetical protein